MSSKIAIVLLSAAVSAWAQLPNPYKPPIENWGTMPAGRAWGSVSGIAIDAKGNLWMAERCGANTCAGSTLDPIFEFDRFGKYLRSFGAGLFVFPHQIFVDRDGFVWVTDGDGKDGKGHTVVKFSPEGKVLMTLGRQGVAGNGPDTFNRPSGVVVAPTAISLCPTDMAAIPMRAPRVPVMRETAKARLGPRRGRSGDEAHRSRWTRANEPIEVE